MRSPTWGNPRLVSKDGNPDPIVLGLPLTAKLTQSGIEFSGHWKRPRWSTQSLNRVLVSVCIRSANVAANALPANALVEQGLRIAFLVSGQRCHSKRPGLGGCST